jgi:hypothetical protein
MGFRGRIVRLSQLIADSITGATINGGTITGALFRTATSGKRWEIVSNPSNEIHGFSGLPGEQQYGRILVDADTVSGQAWFYIAPPTFVPTLENPGTSPAIYLLQNYKATPITASIQAIADTHEWKVETTAQVAGGGGVPSQDMTLDSTGLKLNGTPVLTGADSGWQALTYNTGWAAFGSGWPGAAYRTIGNRVYVRGLVANSGTLTAGTAYTILTLPSGARPATNLMFSASVGNLGMRMDVIPTGAVSIVPNASIPAGTYVSIVCSFLTD